MKKMLFLVVILSVLIGCNTKKVKINSNAECITETKGAIKTNTVESYVPVVSEESIMREHAEKLFREGRYDEIVFYLNNGELCEYRRFAEGEMFTINQDNKLVWYVDSKKHDPDYSYKNFIFYLDMVFFYAPKLINN